MTKWVQNRYMQKEKKKTKYMDRIYKWIQLQNEWSPFAKTLVT